ncbi:hypothetical protein Z042_20545 [Chania multitudinisentens RB-25]|uniref:Fimbrial chaperone protein n=1 Tax=Chania multitudinisentens RB-25 TaxID=1441930 RepID=W0LH68_9GAMM|nr:molecular chaperone [Chania multitudinisentens]AHG21729.1 hypothetical protein Z042_20545 [Chania multitudinisentens RB-25]
MNIKYFSGLLAAVLLSCPLVQAAPQERSGISLSQTRVVFDAKATSTTVGIRNYSDRPWLIRAQVMTAPGGTQSAPFMVTPPLFRLEPNSQSTVRILRQGTDVLPTDRESVFYLSFLAIPSSSKPDSDTASAVSAQVTVGIDTVIKLFYRPSGLALTPQDAAAKLTVRLQDNEVEVNNPTPYYQTLISFSLDGKPVAVREAGSMIAPFTSQRYPASGQPRQASWSVINDYGGISPSYQATISHGEAP